MDGETNYESDISESWSLIDINLNEESLSVTEASESQESDLKNENLGKPDELEIEDFLRKCKETNKTDFSRISDSEYGSSFNNHESECCSRTDNKFSSRKRCDDDDGKNDSCDNESIEILEVDGNYQDSELDRLEISTIDQLNISTYPSDDDESSGGRDNSEYSNNSTVIRRRKRLSRSSVDDVHSVNSRNKSESKEARANVEELTELNVSPVYKHYRNNVVNTVLSLSVGVIFAGVACLAIGHFLGVKDASETAVELAEALKKLQAENAALQSGLFNLNKALLNLEMNSKLELPLNEETPQEKGDLSKAQLTDLNNAALSAVRSSLNSIEWLSKLQSFIRKTDKMNERESGVDFNGLGKYITDQMQSLNRRMEDGAKFFEDADKKISKYLQSIIKRLSSSQDNIEILHKRLIKLKDGLNQKMNEVSTFREEAKKKIPVTELELQTMQWSPKNNIEKSNHQDYQKSVLFYKFPQPEKYYENNPPGREFESPTSNHTVKNEKQAKRKMEEKKKVKKQGKKEKSKEKKEKKRNKKGKWDKFEKVLRNFEKRQKKDNKHHVTFNQVAYNVTVPKSKKYSKLGEKTIKYKRKCKKFKQSKLKKVSMPNLKKNSYLKKKNYRQMCSKPQCFNVTGHWVFKWADGREEFRRYQSVGEWQFDRAKARKEQRDNNYNENWQFKRAIARENNRWNREKYEKYFGKDFFHERFSWI